MKLKLRFLLIICLAIILSFLVYIHPVSAQPQCPGSSGCPVITSTGAYRGPTRRELLELILWIVQGNVTEAESLLTQYLEQTKSTQDLSRQAVAHQALGDLYTIMNKPDSASSELMSAKALYQAVGNAQGVSEVDMQLQEIQSPQIQFQPGEVQAFPRYLLNNYDYLRKTQAPQIRPEIVSPQIQLLPR